MTVDSSRTESGNSRATTRTAKVNKKKKNLDEAWRNAAHLDDSIGPGGRRSGRTGKSVTYAENSDSEDDDDDGGGDDEEMEVVQDHQEGSDIVHDNDSDNVHDGDDKVHDNQREDDINDVKDGPGQMDEQTSPSSVVPLRPRRTATTRSSAGGNHTRATTTTTTTTTNTITNKSESVKGKHHLKKTVQTTHLIENDDSNDNDNDDNDHGKGKEEIETPKRDGPGRPPKNKTRGTRRLSRKLMAIVADSESVSTSVPTPVGGRNTRATSHLLEDPKSPPAPPPPTTATTIVTTNNNKVKDDGDHQKGRRANEKGKEKEDVIEDEERDLLATSDSDELSDPPPSDQDIQP